jgi:glycosyltransferase involved in cell wall biosynthesis
MAQLKALIITSDHEGLPMVALESLALGVPIVSHAVGGLAEIIESEKHGQLVPSQDVRLFADAIEFATSSSEDSGQSRLPARYGIQETASRYIELYAALTAKRP